MRTQYPPTASARSVLSQYIVNELQVNVMENFFSLFGGTKTVACKNGMVFVGNLVFPYELIETDDGSTSPAVLQAVHEEQLVYLSIHCLCLSQTVPVVAAFAYAQTLLHPESVLCTKVWNAFSYLFLAPTTVLGALTCERPDIQRTVQLLYGQWLIFCRSPAAISDALSYVSARTWHFLSSSKAYQILKTTIYSAQIAVALTRSNTRADIVIDDRAKLFVSHRDKCLLALLFCAGPNRKVIGLDEPMFITIESEFPEAFVEQPFGFSALDEIA